MNFNKPNIVISKCIEFDHCRWNDSMISSAVVKKLKPFINFITVCPESEIGLGIPRKPVRIVLKNDKQSLMQLETNLDVTEKITNFANQYLDSISEIDGFILKDRSPSCGDRHVKLYPSTEKSPALPEKTRGFFAKAVFDKFKHLAIENEGRLTNLFIREHYLTKIYTLANFRKIKKESKINSLMNFQKENKLLFMAYNQTKQHEMGRVIAQYNKTNLQEIYNTYEELLYNCLKQTPRYTSNINVLMHAAGYFKQQLNSDEKKYFSALLDKYRKKIIPLSTCNAVINSWIARFNEKYLENQTFFSPYPEELIINSDSSKI